MDSSQMQTDTGSSASGSIPDFQESPRTCAGTCAQCREAAQQREQVAKAMPDITGRPDLVRLVDTFYEKVRADPQLGHVQQSRYTNYRNPAVGQ